MILDGAPSDSGQLLLFGQTSQLHRRRRHQERDPMFMEPQHPNIRWYTEWIRAFEHLELVDPDAFDVLLRVALEYYEPFGVPFEPPEIWRLARQCRIRKDRVAAALRRAEDEGLLDVTADGDWIPRIPRREVSHGAR